MMDWIRSAFSGFALALGNITGWTPLVTVNEARVLREDDEQSMSSSRILVFMYGRDEWIYRYPVDVREIEIAGAGSRYPGEVGEGKLLNEEY